jgi:hypothetical protein
MTYPYMPGSIPGQPAAPPPAAAYPSQWAAAYYGQAGAAPGGAPLPPGVVAQPHWAGGYAPASAGPPAPAMPSQFGPPAGATPQQFESQRIPASADWPPELHGRTLGEARRYYAIMRQDFVARQQELASGRGAPPLAGQPGWQGGGGQGAPGGPAPAGSPPGGSGYGAPQVDPVRQAVQEALAAALPQALAPMHSSAAQMAYQRVASQYPDFRQFEAEIIESLRGSPPEFLANPQAWETAYDLIRGRALRGQRLLPPGGGQQPPQFPPAQPGYAPAPGGWTPPAAAPPANPWGAPSPPAWGPPAPPAQAPGYFSEAPTPPAPVPGNAQADPRDEVAARRFGIPLEVYRASKADPDTAARWLLAARGNGQPGQGPAAAAPAPGYGGGYPVNPPAMAPGYGPPNPWAPMPPQFFGPPSAYAGMTTPNGGYYGQR